VEKPAEIIKSDIGIRSAVQYGQSLFSMSIYNMAEYLDVENKKRSLKIMT